MKTLLTRFAVLLVVLLGVKPGCTQQVLTFDYLNSGLGSSCNVFNPSVAINGITHNSWAGGVYLRTFSGVDYGLLFVAGNSGNGKGRAIRIDYPFAPGFKYNITLRTEFGESDALLRTSVVTDPNLFPSASFTACGLDDNVGNYSLSGLGQMESSTNGSPKNHMVPEFTVTGSTTYPYLFVWIKGLFNNSGVNELSISQISITKTLIVSGDVSNLCQSGTRTFSVADVPGYTYSWTYSGNLTNLTSGGATNTHELTVQPNTSVAENASVEATVTSSGSMAPVSSTVSFPINAPVTLNHVIQGCSGGRRTWQLSLNPATLVSSPYWSVGYGTGIYIYTPSSPNTYVDVTGGGVVNASYTNACGVAKNASITVYNSGCYSFSMIASPNPTRGNINLSIAEEDVNNLSLMQGLSFNTTLAKIDSKGKTIISLFDMNTSRLVKQWKHNEVKMAKYALDIAGLKKGIYILQVDRENITKLEKIIVE
jgi:hypothetical protein